MLTGSESWAGFANEDASLYPFTFGEGGFYYFLIKQMALQKTEIYLDLNLILTLTLNQVSIQK